MDCQEYIEWYLSAHADDELSARERKLASDHLAECPECRARLAEERALKASIRRHLAISKAPGDVRLRIRAALGEVAEHGATAGRAASERPQISRRFPALAGWSSARARRRDDNTSSSRARREETVRWRNRVRPWLTGQLRRAEYIAPAAFVLVVLSASVAAVKVLFQTASSRPTQSYAHSVPAFDFAIASYNRLSAGFAPNVPAEAYSADNGASYAWVEQEDPVHHVSDELPDISSSYEKIHMPPELCDFEMAGYQLAGGRVDSLPSGAPVTYTLYRNGDDSILSVSLKQRMGAPQGGYWFESHAFYSYQGYSLCLTIDPIGHFASIIVTRAPLTKLLSDVAVSDIAFLDQ